MIKKSFTQPPSVVKNLSTAQIGLEQCLEGYCFQSLFLFLRFVLGIQQQLFYLLSARHLVGLISGHCATLNRCGVAPSSYTAVLNYHQVIVILCALDWHSL